MAEINIGELSEAINDKMDRDVQNIDTTTGSPFVAGLGMPDYANGAEKTTSGFTADSNGWVYVRFIGNSSTVIAKANNTNIIIEGTGGNQTIDIAQLAPVSKGDVISFSINGSPQTVNVYFYPCLGG